MRNDERFRASNRLQVQENHSRKKHISRLVYDALNASEEYRFDRIDKSKVLVLSLMNFSQKILYKIISLFFLV